LAGLRQGAQIASVNGVDIQGKSYADVIAIIEGEKTSATSDLYCSTHAYAHAHACTQVLTRARMHMHARSRSPLPRIHAHARKELLPLRPHAYTRICTPLPLNNRPLNHHRLPTSMTAHAQYRCTRVLRPILSCHSTTLVPLHSLPSTTPTRTCA